jgi:hypothetical protein
VSKKLLSGSFFQFINSLTHKRASELGGWFQRQGKKLSRSPAGPKLRRFLSVTGLERLEDRVLLSVTVGLNPNQVNFNGD